MWSFNLKQIANLLNRVNKITHYIVYLVTNVFDVFNFWNLRLPFMKFPLDLTSIIRMKSRCSVKYCLQALFYVSVACSWFWTLSWNKKKELFLYSILHGIIFMIIHDYPCNRYKYLCIRITSQRICITV